MDKADHVAPGKAVLHDRHRSLANRRPHPSLQRFEPDAMLIHGPQLYLGVGKGGSDRS